MPETAKPSRVRETLYLTARVLGFCYNCSTMPSTQVTAFFESLQTEADLNALIGNEKEGLYVEFKMKKNRSHGNLDDSDKWQFSRALSGFANSI